MALVQNNSLLAISPPIIPQTQVLGSIWASGDDLYWDVWFRYPLLFKIIEAESQWNPLICNQQYGCQAGMGLIQLIPSTVKYCEQKLARLIDPFNPEDSVACGIWLLENEGSYHWGTATSSWGSYRNWSQ